MNNYVFPFQSVEKGEKIAIYGAGTVGKCFYKQLITSGYASIVLWVDKNYEKLQEQGIPVYDIEKIQNFSDISHIIIAIDNREIALSVFDELNKKYGISKDKIIWNENYRFADEGLFIDQNQQREFGLSEELKKISPKKMLHFNRLDLAVRYLLAKDIVFGIENRENISLYSRMILARTGAYENDTFYFDSIRRGTQDYISAIKKVCTSIKENGYLKDGYVPVGSNDVFLNGAHRIAASLALENDIWVSHLYGKNGNTDFSMQWFVENGFNTSDKIRILRAYADLYENCGIIILFAPSMDLWDYLEKQLSRVMTVVGSVELDFSDNYIAFENLFREIYSDPLWRNVYIDRKVELLKMSPLRMRILLVSDEKFEKSDLYKTIENMKLELRDRMFWDTDIAPVVMHGSNSKSEFVHLKQVVLSVNNLKHLRMRSARNYSEDFINRQERLKKILAEKGVSLQDVVITGSSGWELYGLRKADDIDFAFSDKYREEFGEEHQIWEEKIDYTRKNSIEISDDVVYPDELLIKDDNYHYVFNGLKFVNIDLIAKKKAYNKREKDLRDVRLYELFMDYALNFDDKVILKKQIEKEFYKKR